MIRAFLALPLPEALVPAATLAQHALRLDEGVAREDLHLTLAFLGRQPVPVLEDLHAALSVEALRPAMLRLTGLGVFGPELQRSLHLAVAPDPALEALHRACARAARAAGIVLPARRFQPHITLARLRAAPDAALAQAIARAGVVRADAALAETLVLYESRDSRAGPRYEPMAEYPLRGLGPTA